MNVPDVIVLVCVLGQILALAVLAVVAFGWWGVALDLFVIGSFVAAARLGKRYRKRQMERKGW